MSRAFKIKNTLLFGEGPLQGDVNISFQPSANCQLFHIIHNQESAKSRGTQKTLKGAVSMDHNLKDRGETIDILEHIQKMEDWPPEQQF